MGTIALISKIQLLYKNVEKKQWKNERKVKNQNDYFYSWKLKIMKAKKYEE